MPSVLPSEPPEDAPDDLKTAWPLVLRWGESDDVDRGEIVDAASDEELKTLVGAVDPLFSAINAYLDATRDAERAVPYGDLAQAATAAPANELAYAGTSRRIQRPLINCRFFSNSATGTRISALPRPK